MSSLCYSNIHLLMFISCYCTSIYKKYVMLLGFICNHHKTQLISQIIITTLCLSHKFRINYFCDSFKGHFRLQTTESTTFSKDLITWTQQAIKDAHIEQTLKNGALLGVSRSCDILLKQKGDIVLRLFG